MQLFYKQFLKVKKVYYNISNQRGSVYIMAMVIMVILVVTIMVTLQKILFDVRTLRYSQNNLRAYYIAQAGLEDFIYEVRTHSGFPFSSWITVVPGSSYSRIFPQGVGSPEYQGTYNITVTPVGIFNVDDPSSFNVVVVGEYLDNSELYQHTLRIDGLWTYNREAVHITNYQEE